MKRLLALFSSSSPGKQSESSPSTPPFPKRSKSLVPSSDVHARLDSLERLQARLLALDVECSREQLAIQRKFDELRQPVLEQRRVEIGKIPYFWVTAIGNHPISDSKVFYACDSDPLSFLQEVELLDNLDDNGSYEVRLRFDSGNNPFFPETELVRKLTVLDDFSDDVSATHISWAPGKRPRTDPKSFFTWFAGNGNEDFGEVLRRDLWQNPYPYYLNLSARRGEAPVASDDIELEETADG